MTNLPKLLREQASHERDEARALEIHEGNGRVSFYGGSMGLTDHQIKREVARVLDRLAARIEGANCDDTSH